ncbi:MAG TPA: hypothetical protein VFG59_11315 [Anaeromyxobacter sp.]|nr:hypothetical protein [Anaeromyxobacter sp.]
MSARLLLIGLGLVAAARVPAGEPAAKAEAKEWAVVVEGPAQATSAVTIHLTARAGYHVNKDYPTAFRPGPDSTVTFASARVALKPTAATACAGEPGESCAVTLELPYRAAGSGEARLAGTLDFSVCSKERCLIEKVPLRAQLAAGSGRG